MDMEKHWYACLARLYLDWIGKDLRCISRYGFLVLYGRLHCTAKPCLDFDMESTGLNMESTEVRALLVLDMESTEVRALLDWIGYGKH